MTGPRGTDAEQQTPRETAPRETAPRETAPPGRGEPAAGRRADSPPVGSAASSRRAEDGTGTTVLPGGSGGADSQPGARRPGPPRSAPPRPERRSELRPAAGGRSLVGKSRRARLSLRRLDPWSVFLFSLVASVFVGIALIVAVAVLFFVLGALGVTDSLNELFDEVTGGTGSALLTANRVVGGAAVLAAVNVVFLTLLATLGALLYNLCASFTGGIELMLGERE